MPAAPEWPERIGSEDELDDLLTRPSPPLVEMMKRLPGDIIILGIGGKMGVTLGVLAARAIREAGAAKRVVGVSRFSDPLAEEKLNAAGIETIACDLLDRAAVNALPRLENVVFMAGRKFGTGGKEPLTWAMNTTVPANVADHFRDGRIVAFSTGCVYPLMPPAGGGCTEETPTAPVGEYAQSCLGRERIFQYHSIANGTPVCLFRLNYAIDLRYGVLHDIGSSVWGGEPIDVTIGRFNIIWQGDANRMALQCLEHCTSPATPLNVTGPDALSTRQIATAFGEIMGRPVRFVGEESEAVFLSNASRALGLFGGTTVSVDQMIAWNAHWVMAGGRSLGKPTHFEVKDGEF
jgi:nucleoside-diphosphate-sugar epimerase